jgi:hypothetical protein
MVHSAEELSAWQCTFAGVLGVDELDVDMVLWSIGQLGPCGLAGDS